MKRITLAIAALTALVTSGCLQKDTTSTIYLNTDGTVEWTVLEQRVRSDAGTLEEQSSEERPYTDAIDRDEHPVAVGFRNLGGQDVRTHRIRDTRPWATMVEGRFSGLDAIAEPILSACGISHSSATVIHDGVTTWTLRADLGPDIETAAPEDCDRDFTGLTDAADLTIVLISGRFVSATGFTIDGDRAVPEDDALTDDAIAKNGGRLVLSLSWMSGQR